MAKNKQKKVSKTYTKTHSSPVAVASHKRKIIKRGGKVVSEIKTKTKTSLVYGFPE
jgi:ABC-type uncharacterized transport system ATPase component